MKFKPQNFALISLFLFLAWLISVLNLRPTYQNIAGIDPLGMVDVLFPTFWIILIALVSLCFIVFLQKESPRWLHILLLCELSLIFFYTPFLLGGFSWSPDSLWHGGVASYMPSILSGAKLPLTNYAQSYPFSFLLTYAIENLFGLSVETYTLYVFPPVCLILISSLAYFFSSRILNPQTAFLGMLIALPVLHYLEPHVSPYATGTVLLLSSLVLLTYKSPKAIALSFIFIIISALTHPISPIFIGVYTFAILVVSLIVKKDIRISSNIFGQIPRLALTFIVLTCIWLTCTVYATPKYIGVAAAVTKFFSFDFINKLLYTYEWTVGGQGFVFNEISQLSLFIYGIFLGIITLVFIGSVCKFLRNRKNGLDKIVPLRLALTITAFLSVFMSYLLFASSGERFLLGRGMIFFLLMGSLCIATYVVGSKTKRSKIMKAIVFIFILFFSVTFPLIAYSKEAYNTFTPSADAGLKYLSSNFDLSKLSLSMAMDQQLAAYADLAKGLTLTDFPPTLTTLNSTFDLSNPDLIVLRINSYFVISMRYDFSFSENRYTNISEVLTENPFYNRVYDNSEFEIYSKIP